MIATLKSRRSLVGLVLVVIAANGAFWGFRYFSDPTVGQAGVRTDQVMVVADAFSPPVIEVPVGTEVTWTFADVEEHNVIFDGFGSNVLLTGTYSHTFEAAGEFPYVCTLHPLSMKGRVIVTDPSE
jgi:plastocyanin